MKSIINETAWLNWAYHDSGSFLIAVPVRMTLTRYENQLIPTSQRVAMSYEASRVLNRFIDPTKLASECDMMRFTVASHPVWPWYKVVHYRG